MSRRAGTLRSKLSPSESSVAHRMGNAAFFAPLTSTVPDSLFPPRIRMASMNAGRLLALHSRRRFVEDCPIPSSAVTLDAMRIALTHNLRLTDSVVEAEFDSPETIDALAQSLASAGHDVERIEVSGPASR